ncbi:MAG: endonuclease V [Candidatus Muproteobacteria bacterium RBG_16_62_13]|uniref:Endonuclease V n=1 Tax=Candidatus Muproteobacteria bacterium RBG_16_62_13 TaxID=1817756 RepID=A0A1F6T920_9PROT|nr:MAG: endonuclease V [Candidatus Muproteobacteria bacterium RBG_16_62_13]
MKQESWPQTVAEARAVQEQLRGKVVTRDRIGRVRMVAGIDIGYEGENNLARAAAVVLAYPALEPVEAAVVRVPVKFPYVPGYLSFREVPALLAVFAQLKHKPDLILCDGQGLAHPRRFGLACHLGVLLDIPTIGVAKSRLIGEPRGRLGRAKGAWVPLIDHDEIIGAVLRTRTGVKPLYVSIGHRVSLATALDFVLRCTPRYRLPETTRRAHRLASG